MSNAHTNNPVVPSVGAVPESPSAVSVGSGRLVRAKQRRARLRVQAIRDVAQWSLEYSTARNGTFSDMVYERAESDAEREEWRKAYEWVDDILRHAAAKLGPNKADMTK